MAILAFLGLMLGVALLIGGGWLMVHGASGVATRYGISRVIVGLTIVAFGTSVPELVVNVLGALQGETALAFGNVVGSNLANMGLVLAAAALIKPMEIHGQIVRREVPLLLLATSVILVMAADPALRGLPAAIDRSDSIIICLLFCIFLYTAAQDVYRRRETDAIMRDVDSSPLLKTTTGSYDWLAVIGGTALLLGGGHLAITNSVALAASLNVSTTLVGLFIVAIGTSLPELITSVTAAMRGESDLAIGNVVGSNLFNGLFVLPMSGLARPIRIPDGGMVDLGVSLLFAAVLIPVFLYGRARLGRRMGLALMGGYFAYAFTRIT